MMNLGLILPPVVSFILSAVLCKLLIPVLRKLKVGQQIRKEGNPDHLKKQGTPTMGGIAFLLAILAVGVVAAFFDVRIVPALVMTLLFGAIGFVDDYLKVVKKQSEGFKPKEKFICQALVTVAFTAYCYFSPAVGTEVVLPFTGGKTWDMGLLYIPFVLIAVTGTDNGVNFTDGLDGLCSWVTAVIAALLMIFAALQDRFGLQALSGAVAGALFGFLLFNHYPAKVFMGDTGSLALGAFVSATAICLKMGWFILIFGLIYFVEVLSVMIQVAYFKKTHGKRFFKMAPIHHHFEKCGYRENQIVFAFTLVTAVLCVISYFAFTGI